MSLKKHLQCILTGDLAEAIEIIQKYYRINDSNLIRKLLVDMLIRKGFGISNPENKDGIKLDKERLNSIKPQKNTDDFL